MTLSSLLDSHYLLANMKQSTAGLAPRPSAALLLVVIVSAALSAPIPPTPETLGVAYGLYDHDKVFLLEELRTMTMHYIEWDPTHTLENAAGMVATCDMIDYDIYSWNWDALETPRIKSQLTHFTRGRGATGVFGFSRSSTLLTPWREWQDLKRIVEVWLAAPDYAGEYKAMMNTERIGCAVIPGCMRNGHYYTLLVCLLSPKVKMVPSSDEIELEQQPHISLTGPFVGDSPMTPIKEQDYLPIEDARIQYQEKQKNSGVVFPHDKDLLLEPQDYLPEKLYNVKMPLQWDSPAEKRKKRKS